VRRTPSKVFEIKKGIIHYVLVVVVGQLFFGRIPTSYFTLYTY
jgi:hypothetical protein